MRKQWRADNAADSKLVLLASNCTAWTLPFHVMRQRINPPPFFIRRSALIWYCGAINRCQLWKKNLQQFVVLWDRKNSCLRLSTDNIFCVHYVLGARAVVRGGFTCSTFPPGHYDEIFLSCMTVCSQHAVKKSSQVCTIQNKNSNIFPHPHEALVAPRYSGLRPLVCLPTLIESPKWNSWLRPCLWHTLLL